MINSSYKREQKKTIFFVMKTKTNITFLLAFLSGICLFSCSQDEEAAPVRKMIESQVPEDFNYETLKTIPTDLSFTYSDLLLSCMFFFKNHNDY